MIVGVGVDVVDVARFTAALTRTPRLRGRLFTAGETQRADGSPRPDNSLAARFAAKEAVAKALGAPAGMHWHDCEIQTEPNGRPIIAVTGTVAAVAAAAGISSWHLSLSHDGGLAVAYVLAQR